jgi:hypothetical protein
MPGVNSLKKKEMEQNHQCKYCGNKFHKEITLATHMCVKKRRYVDKESPGPRLGLRVFQRFYDLTTQSKKVKTVDDFINSPYYIGFTKFGNHLASLKPLYIEKFIDFVILSGVGLKDWTKDAMYSAYVEDIIKKEPADGAIDRSITNIITWCEQNNSAFGDFFESVSANEAAYMIQTGKISPWALYLSESGGNLIDRFSEDHSKMIGDMIDPGFWMKRFKKSDEDVTYIRELLEQAGI